MKGRVKRF